MFKKVQQCCGKIGKYHKYFVEVKIIYLKDAQKALKLLYIHLGPAFDPLQLSGLKQ